MPPQVKSPVPSETWALDAQHWLEHNGLVARIPNIRASDYDLSLSDPFRYYLTRRLGIRCTSSLPRALSIGQWLHSRFEYFGLPREEWTSALDLRLAERITQIEERCAASRVPSDVRRSLVEEERGNFVMATTMYAASEYLEFAKDRSIGSYLRRPEWRLLPPELTLSIDHPLCPRTKLVCRPDRLAYHERHNSLWIIDYKSTSFSPLARLSICPNEFATLHYSFIVNYMLENGLIHETFPDLPSNLTFGGMVHIAVQKPAIRFSALDRDYTTETRELKSGPRKGTSIVERKYYGEPKQDNYLTRMTMWYKGEGEYVDLKGTRQNDPPVNMSFTYPSYLLDTNTTSLYLQRLNHLYRMAVQDPIPLAFPQASNIISPYGRVSDYLPFYVNPPRDWPEIISNGNFLVLHREDEEQEDEPQPQE